MPNTPVSLSHTDERSRVPAAPARLGPYWLFERLGTGGQASVYRGRRAGDPAAHDVAIKRLHPHLIDDAHAIQSFGKEAKVAYLIDHPAIRRVQALCRDATELYMVMEYVDGVALNRVLRRANAAKRHLPLRGILSVLHRLCEALHYAHELIDERGAPAGLVHRDVSPSNVLVTTSGQLKLIDLGVARSEAPDHHTSSGLIKGKFGYMAPEVMWNVPFDRRADVFSAGVVAWELLTSNKLYPVKDPPIDLQRVRARPVEPPSRRNPACPPDLDAIVLRALATEPTARWASCAEMAEAIAGVATRLGEPISDAAIAELAEQLVAADPGRAPTAGPTPPKPRARLARGTAPELPPTRSMHVLSALPVHGGPCPRCRRNLALGAAGGAAGALALVAVATLVVRATAAPGPATPPPTGAPTAPAAVAPRDAAVAATAPDDDAGAVTPSADAAPVAVTPAPPDPAIVEPRPVDPEHGAPRIVEASELTRLAAPPPKSRSTRARYRARLCIDTVGSVYSVTVLDGPARLEERIARALLRWRYEPYLEDGIARPVCFDVEARVKKID